MKDTKVTVSKKEKEDSVCLGDLNEGDLFVYYGELCRLIEKGEKWGRCHYRAVDCWNEGDISENTRVEVPEEVNIEYTL